MLVTWRLRQWGLLDTWIHGQIPGRIGAPHGANLMWIDLAADFLTVYWIDRKRSLDKARRSVRYLQRFFGGIRTVDITTDKLRAYVKERQEAGTLTLRSIRSWQP